MSGKTPSPTISHGSDATQDATPDTDRRARVRLALLADNAVVLSPAMSSRVAEDVALFEAAMALTRFSREAHRCSWDEIRRASSPPSASAPAPAPASPEAGTRTIVGKGGRRGAGKARPKHPSAAAAKKKKKKEKEGKKEKKKESVVGDGDGDSGRVRGAVAGQKAASFTMVLRKNARTERCVC